MAALTTCIALGSGLRRAGGECPGPGDLPSGRFTRRKTCCCRPGRGAAGLDDFGARLLAATTCSSYKAGEGLSLDPASTGAPACASGQGRLGRDATDLRTDRHGSAVSAGHAGRRRRQLISIRP